MAGATELLRSVSSAMPGRQHSSISDTEARAWLSIETFRTFQSSESETGTGISKSLPWKSPVAVLAGGEGTAQLDRKLAVRDTAGDGLSGRYCFSKIRTFFTCWP